jgi:hypothetical protein
MNKVIAAVGLAVVSAASLQAQYAPNLTPLEASKPWTLSADVRGFYDDNYLTLPKTEIINGAVVHRMGTWGSEVIPGAALNHSVENTLYSLSYVYDMKWYDNGSNTMDQTHQFNGSLQHEFSDRYKLSLSDSFAIAQQPDVLSQSSGAQAGVLNSPLRVSGSNIRNTSQIDFTAQLTKLFDVHLGYNNGVTAYQQVDRSVIGYPFTGAYSSYFPTPSYSDLLDVMSQMYTVDLRWKATPETTGILGYQYGETWYTSPGYIIYPYGGNSPYNTTYTPGAGMAAASAGYRSNIRNSDSHFAFVGADESFTPELNGSLRVGTEYLDYYNYGTSRLSPYIDVSLTDQYLPGDSAQLGVKHIHNSTDVAGFLGTTPVMDEESTVIYLSDTHKLSEKLTATVLGQAQMSTFVGGGSGFNGKEEDFFSMQFNLAYHINPWLTTEAGYNYSKLNTELANRAYTRDLMYLGVKATY